MDLMRLETDERIAEAERSLGERTQEFIALMKKETTGQIEIIREDVFHVFESQMIQFRKQIKDVEESFLVIRKQAEAYSEMQKLQEEEDE